LQLALPVLYATTVAEEVGFYAVGISYAIPVGLITSSIAIHTLSDVAAADRASIAAITRRRLRANAASLGVLGSVWVLAAPLIVPLAFGREFAPAVGAAQLLVIAQAASSITLLQAEVCRALGRPGMASMAEGLGVIGTVALLPVIVPPFGIEGAACAAIAVNVCVTILLRRKLNHYLGRLADAARV
jgi:O-antigen/teichoic acid export membrane protein